MAQPPVWHPFLTELQQAIDPDADGQDYYGFYNALLTIAFPFDQRYIVAPQTYPNTQTERTPFDNLINYYVQFGKYIVLGVEVKPSNVFSYPSWIASAQEQVYARFRTMRATIRNAQLPTFVIISAIGFKCRVYTYTLATNQVEPPKLPSTQDQWDIDITTDQGRVRLAAVFRGIRERSALLPQNVDAMLP
ncbi:hypothetical protein EDD21DRAFT_369957 [Dissophora ornata]|nr:hypothetical protein BGZ58_000228 [Dissophora ornata]KAI8603140.1 hypothetical protein EDD21DRAFT_369957 [Dissophora ornata]